MYSNIITLEFVGVGTLSLSWEGGNQWVLPQLRLVGAAIAHLRACWASVTLLEDSDAVPVRVGGRR
jgi:hypothetical protein